VEDAEAPTEHPDGVWYSSFSTPQVSCVYDLISIRSINMIN
jgi:hypothetical protein